MVVWRRSMQRAAADAALQRSLSPTDRPVGQCFEAWLGRCSEAWRSVMAVPLQRRLPKRKLLYLAERTAMNVETPWTWRRSRRRPERQWPREPRGVSSL